MSEMTNDNTIIDRLAEATSALVLIAFQMPPGPLRDSIATAVENILSAPGRERPAKIAESKKRGRPRKSSNGGEADAPAAEHAG